MTGEERRVRSGFYDKKPSIVQASERTIEAAVAHWRAIASATDPAVRCLAVIELQALDNEIEARRKQGLWRTGAFPGLSTFRA